MLDIDDLVNTLKIGELEVDVLLTSGQLAKAMHKVTAATEADGAAVYDLILDILRKAVVDIRGLGKGGKPLSWSPKVIDDLPYQLTGVIWKALMNLGDQQQVGDPLAASTK